jgi:hypothetical protein
MEQRDMQPLDRMARYAQTMSAADVVAECRDTRGGCRVREKAEEQSIGRSRCI